MPTYTFEDKDTGEVFDKLMKISEKEQYLKDNPNLKSVLIFAKNFEAITIDHTLELSQIDKERIFNLGYYTWVEQQGTSLEEFENRRNQSFWDKHYKDMISLDPKIKEFNSL